MKNKELIVGLFMAVTIVLLYFGFNFLKGIDFFSSNSKYFTVYDNVDQLAVGNSVLVNGFAVGRVSKIRIMQNRQNRVLVELDIDADIKLGDSSKAILSSDFLGTKSILIALGNSRKELKPRDTLKSEVAKGMFDVISETATPVADNLQTTLRKFNEIIDKLSTNAKQLEEIFEKFKATPDLLNKTIGNANGRIEEMSGSFKSVTDNLNNTLRELEPTVKNFRSVSDSLKQLRLNQTITRTQQTLASLNETLAKLKKGDNTVSKLMTEDSLYNNLNHLLVSLDSLAKHLDNNPKHFLAPLGKSKKKIDRDRRKEEEERKKKAEQKK